MNRPIEFRAWIECHKNKYDDELKDYRDKLYRDGKRFGSNRYEYSKITLEMFEKERDIKYEEGRYSEYRMDYTPNIDGDECFGGGGMCNLNEEFGKKQSVYMQFTGKHDKNKKKVFEGDRIRVTDEHGNITQGAVWYVPERMAFCIVWHEGKSSFSLADNEDLIEVVGNVFENPELLSSKDI